MIIYINTVTLEEIELDVDPNDTIASVKQKIWAKKGWKVEDQRLIYNQVELVDKSTVTESEIEEESSIIILLRVEGEAAPPTLPEILEGENIHEDISTLIRTLAAVKPPLLTSAFRSEFRQVTGREPTVGECTLYISAQGQAHKVALQDGIGGSSAARSNAFIRKSTTKVNAEAPASAAPTPKPKSKPTAVSAAMPITITPRADGATVFVSESAPGGIPYPNNTAMFKKGFLNAAVGWELPKGKISVLELVVKGDGMAVGVILKSRLPLAANYGPAKKEGICSVDQGGHVNVETSMKLYKPAFWAKDRPTPVTLEMDGSRTLRFFVEGKLIIPVFTKVPEGVFFLLGTTGWGEGTAQVVSLRTAASAKAQTGGVKCEEFEWGVKIQRESKF